MQGIERIEKGGRVYAVFYRKTLKAKDGPLFLTKPEEPLQIGVIEYGKGEGSKPHRHASVRPERPSFREFLYIEKGSVRVRIFDDNWAMLAERALSSGDFVLLMDGGHSVEAIASCRIVEVKLGPYPGADAAKTFPEVL